MDNDHRKQNIVLMILEKASKGKKITRSNIQKLVETSRSHVTFNDMFELVNATLVDVFGLELRSLNEQNSEYALVNQFSPVHHEGDAAQVRLVDIVRFPILSMAVSSISHSPMAKIELAEFKAAAGDTQLLAEIKQDTGLTVDVIVKQLVDAGYLMIEEDSKGLQWLVKGSRITVELPDEAPLDASLEGMIERLRSDADARRRPTPMSATDGSA